MKASCSFCSIAGHTTSADSVFEDEISLAFLDHRPLFPGHCLLVPKEHVPTLADLPDALLGPLFTNVRLLARAVEEGMQAEGAFIAINEKVSQSVHHLHVHVVPRRKGDGLKGFFWPRHPYASEAERTRAANLIRSAMARIRG